LNVEKKAVREMVEATVQCGARDVAIVRRRADDIRTHDRQLGALSAA